MNRMNRETGTGTSERRDIPMKEKVAGLPAGPGVYLMKDGRGDIIYIGKSKNLKQRVSSYFQPSAAHSSKIRRMVPQIRDLDIIRTDTEFEALMLECRLIRERRPIYNRKMKTPRAYVYVAVAPGEGARALRLVREPDAAAEGRVFGPYTAGAGSIERAAAAVRELLGLACLKNRPDGIPCLNVKLGKCLGFCRGGEDGQRHREQTERLSELMEGSDDGVYREWERKMEEAAGQFDFERAAKLRDGLAALRLLMSKQRVASFAAENRNLIVLEELDANTAKVFCVRRNAVLHSEKVDWAGIGGPEGLLLRLREAATGIFAPVQQEVGAEAIRREEIDEAQIIYSYLRSGAAKAVEIPAEWLAPGAAAALEEGLRRLTETGSSDL